MTELAAGAVSSLLVVIRNEALLLGGVKDDVQFIKEEMESMKSFLTHLSRPRAAPGGEHDEQVRTWMNQVRVLAQDCNNCIDLYLYSGNPDIHRAKSRLRRNLWWAYWFLRKMVAQHRAAVQLRQLKDRARDVGERRLRYGVEVPEKTAAGYATAVSGGPNKILAKGDYTPEDDEDPEDQLMVSTLTRTAFCETSTLDDHVRAKLLEWFNGFPPNANETHSIAIMAPNTYPEALALVRDTLAVAPTYSRPGYHRVILVNIPAVHPDFLPLRPKEVLYYILRELKLKRAKSQDTYQGEGMEEELDPWQDHHKKYFIYCDKKKELSRIKGVIKKMKICDKLDKIKHDVQVRQENGKDDQKRLLHQMADLGQNKDVGLDVPFLLLHQSTTADASQQDQVKNKDIHQLPEWDENIILKIAEKLKEHMEADEKSMKLKKQIGVEEKEEISNQERGEARKEEENEEMEKEKQEKGRKEEKGEKEHVDNDSDNDDDDDDEEEEEGLIRIHEYQYAQILREVFPKTSSIKQLQAEQQDRSSSKQATNIKMSTLDEERIKQMIHEAQQEVLRKLKEDTPNKNQAIGKPGITSQTLKADSKEIAQKIEKIKQKLKEQLKINWIVEKIKRHLEGDCPLILLKVDEMMDGSGWEETRQAMNLLDCSADAVIFTTTKSTERAKGFYHPSREPIYYSLVGLYHDKVLELTNQQKNEDNPNPQVFRDILEECEPHEFCMKIFTHALYANPKRSNEELIKLHNALKSSPKSFDIIAKKMFLYSYNDLPKEYKSCLLYLAIFPKGQKIRRSTLIGRWIAEGLIFKEDWPSSVRQANRCFDALIHRWLVNPADIGATGKVKSCVVGDLVHGFITMIARKQHIVETRLSHHLARHFSIFNDLQLRSSDRIENFFQGLSKSSRLSLLKVLDLEGLKCFGGKNQRYLKDICSKMLLLKYLSLRGTDITQLPSEINYLRELEVLDIKQTKVPESATRNILLLKLKRLLAGRIDQSPSNLGTGPSPSNFRTSVQIPNRIDKMVHIEVLSNVKAEHSHDLKDIGKLWQLRKLGVVIRDKDRHLGLLLQTISDLHECLCSLSITTLPEATPHEGTTSIVKLPDSIACCLKNHPNVLENLSISGTTLTGHLLPVITNGGNDRLAKVTLTSIPLNQDGLNILAKLPKLECVRLRYIKCTEPNLTFKKEGFICLKYLLIEGTGTVLTDITFEYGAASELEKMVLSFTSIGSISGVGQLPKLKELEFNGGPVPEDVKEAIGQHRNNPKLNHNEP
ncbi:hypothetical protein BS78_09G062100 [Paspalum vaginatum]|nr:hypothetical protein BS78_09G062100 [Paspalum vaginatum]